MAESLAVQANKQQNMDESKPENTRFPGHYSFQNGVVPENRPTTLQKHNNVWKGGLL